MIRIADSHSDYLSFQVLDDADSHLFDHADLERMEQGGVELQAFAIWVPPQCKDKLTCGLAEIDYLLNFISNNQNRIKLCKTSIDIFDPRIKTILAIESGDSINCRVDQIQHVYDIGARILSLTWNGENEFACGCCCSGGLKTKGIGAINELNRLGIALDLSHINEQGFWEAIDIYQGAPCATHSCVYDLLPCSRNLKKDQIKYIIEKNGYIGINFYTEFLKGRYATISSILDHIDYIIALGGEDVVGLGSDFCGIQYTPTGLNSVADFQKLPQAMEKRGYDKKLILKICYSNFVDYILQFLKQNKVD